MAQMQPLGQVPIPPEMNDLQAQLAMNEVLDEMSNPQGLRLDDPGTDPVSQYKQAIRLELAGHPQTVETQLAGKSVMVETFIVPPAETAVEPPPPEPEPPVLTALDPTEASFEATNVGVQCIGGPFIADEARIIWGGVEQTTQFISESRLACIAPAVAEAGSVDVLVRQGEDETAAQTFTWTEAPAPPPVVPEGQGGTPIVEGA
jgi:hypothetical protein